MAPRASPRCLVAAAVLTRHSWANVPRWGAWALRLASRLPRSAPLAWLSALAPAACAGVVVGAAYSLDARQLVAYGERPAYREYVRTTPLLLPFGRAG